jgi:hypothetical protein
MRRIAILAIFLVAALVGAALLLRQPPEPAEGGTAASPPAPTQSPVPASPEGEAGAATTAAPTTGAALQATLDKLRTDIDLALREDGYPAAHRIVDQAIASAGFSGADQQRVMVVKLGLLGREGDHAAMLDWMDRIIALDPASELARGMAKQRPAIELASKRPANDPGPCATCGEHHPGGVHPLEPGE